LRARDYTTFRASVKVRDHLSHPLRRDSGKSSNRHLSPVQLCEVSATPRRGVKSVLRKSCSEAIFRFSF
jgi:hypothetical protein